VTVIRFDPWRRLLADWRRRPIGPAIAVGLYGYAFDSVHGLDGDPEERSPLDWALFYARRGMRVFPVKANRKPLTEHGFINATTDEKQIREWWRKWPHADVGWAVPSNVVVTDLDVKHQSDVIAEFERRMGRSCGELETPQASSPTGGLHAIFGANGHKYANAVRVDGCAIDLRTEGGYIVLPGANNGRRWLKSLDTPMADAPDWVPTAGKAKAAPAASFQGAKGADADDPAALVFLDQACAAIRAAKNGEQETTLHRKCFAVGGLVGAGWLKRETAEMRLLDAANAMPAYREPWGDLAAKVLASLGGGSQKPWSPRPVIEIAAGDLAREADEAEHALDRAGLPIFTRNFTLVRPVTEDAPASHNRRTRVTILKSVNVDVMIDPKYRS
jgi:Bifunctional DNA primase/polymerase, N-terminal